ncbi:unnamed protein product [Dovyalis caffra]|uniref:DUF982 domain-containing protein n=1 Tax=Dovyalis caffra TaxID=77055 RepID=A0AAV1SL91_9ROSI|nr:unnamed protein product [Dovyalis caffra]
MVEVHVFSWNRIFFNGFFLVLDSHTLRQACKTLAKWPMGSLRQAARAEERILSCIDYA